MLDLNIEELDSVLFVLKRPYWVKADLSDEVLRNGDNRFWYARGIVQEFLDELWQVAIAPIDHSENRLLDFRGRKEKQDLLYLFVPDKTALQQLAALLAAHPRGVVQILVLGPRARTAALRRKASALQAGLARAGVPAERVTVVEVSADMEEPGLRLALPAY